MNEDVKVPNDVLDRKKDLSLYERMREIWDDPKEQEPEEPKIEPINKPENNSGDIQTYPNPTSVHLSSEEKEEDKKLMDTINDTRNKYNDTLGELKEAKIHGERLINEIGQLPSNCPENDRKKLENELADKKEDYEDLMDDLKNYKQELCEANNNRGKKLGYIDIPSVFGNTSDKIPSPIGETGFIPDNTKISTDELTDKTILSKRQSLLFAIDENGKIGRKVDIETLKKADLDGDFRLDGKEIDDYISKMQEKYPGAVEEYYTKEALRQQIGVKYAEAGDKIPHSYEYGMIKGTRRYEESKGDEYYVDFNESKLFSKNPIYELMKDEKGDVTDRRRKAFYNTYNLDDVESLRALQQDVKSGNCKNILLNERFNSNANEQKTTLDDIPGEKPNANEQKHPSGDIPGEEQNANEQKHPSGDIPGEKPNADERETILAGIPGEEQNANEQKTTPAGIPGEEQNANEQEREIITIATMNNDKANNGIPNKSQQSRC